MSAQEYRNRHWRLPGEKETPDTHTALLRALYVDGKRRPVTAAERERGIPEGWISR